MSNLKEMIYEIRQLFKAKPNAKIPTYMFSLVCDQEGYWQIVVTDDWHKWSEMNLKLIYRYPTAEEACIEFLNHVKKNRIDVKALQSKE